MVRTSRRAFSSSSWRCSRPPDSRGMCSLRLGRAAVAGPSGKIVAANVTTDTALNQFSLYRIQPSCGKKCTGGTNYRLGKCRWEKYFDRRRSLRPARVFVFVGLSLALERFRDVLQGPLNSQGLHARGESRGWYAQFLRGAVWAGDFPA